MENNNKEELISKTKELVDLIKNSSDYQNYLELKKKIKDNKEIMTLINKIKKEEKIITNKEYRKEDTKENNKNIDKMKQELESFPIYKEYIYLQEDLNNMFQSIKSIIENSLK